jgi:NTE family protein
MLYHLGALKRLNEFGLLSVVDRFSTVSGGSIAAGILGMLWDALTFDANGIAEGFEAVEEAVVSLADCTVDWQSALVGLFPGTTGAAQISRRYRRVFADRRIADLPAGPPRFIFNTTNVQSGNLFRWSASYGAEYGLGRIDRPRLRLTDVVAASAAFPPWLSPHRLPVPGTVLDFVTGVPIAACPDHLWLTDGGVYDNLGLEAVKSYHSVLVSNGGAPFALGSRVRVGAISQGLRTAALLNDQVGRLRRRHLVEEFRRGERLGALWTISTPMDRYPAAAVLPCPGSATAALAAVTTRLRRVPHDVRDRLINWGYASADAAVRSYVEPGLPSPDGFPRPGGVG